MKNALTKRPATALAAYYFFCGFVLLGKFNFAGRSIWLCILISAVISVVFLFLYDKAMPFLLRSRAYIAFFCLVALMLMAFYLYTVTGFLGTCLIPGMSALITGGFLLLFSLLFGLKGPVPIGRFCTLTSPFLASLLLFIIIIPLFSVEMIYVDSLLSFSPPEWTPPVPALSDLSGFWLGIIFFSLTYSLKGMLLLHAFYLSGYDDLPRFKVVRDGILFTAPLIGAIVISTMLSLGTSLFDLLNYPTYYPLGLLESGEYVQHFELLFLFVYVFTELVDFGVLFCSLFISIQSMSKRPGTVLNQ